jgi:predicted hotdog family 3-hydroxylacyl-ACP dehydratase
MKDKYIDGSPYSEISIIIPDNGTMNITEQVNTYQNTFTTGINESCPGISNEKSKLPCLFLSERYPLSFHSEKHSATTGEFKGSVLSQLH